MRSALQLLFIAWLALGSAISPSDAQTAFDPARTQFVLRCGGCHGPNGVSPPKFVPMLRDTVGWFLCTPTARDYVIRLPNVSRAQLSDADLADVLNYVLFDLGGTSAPPEAEAFNAAEVSAARSKPLNNIPLFAFREQVVTDMVKNCGAPTTLLDYGSHS